MPFTRRALLIVACLGALPLALAAQEGHGPGPHLRFDDPQKWSARFDDPKRDAWQMPDRVIAALDLRPNDVVADIGAGTGYLAVRLARHLKEGIVFAVDMQPNMVKHLAERAKAEGLSNLRPMRGSETSPNLPERVDVVVLLNTYHHISARNDYFRRLAAALKPGGRIAIIDYRPDASAGPPRHLRLSADQIRSEMIAAGYLPAGAHDFLPRQNFLVFRPPE